MMSYKKGIRLPLSENPKRILLLIKELLYIVFENLVLEERLRNELLFNSNITPNVLFRHESSCPPPCRIIKVIFHSKQRNWNVQTLDLKKSF